MSACDHKPTVYPNGLCSECGQRDCDCLDLFPPNADGEIVCRQCWDVLTGVVL